MKMWKIGLLALLLIFSVACASGTSTGDSPSAAGEAPPDPVTLARIRQGESIDGECRFAEDISQYPVTHRRVSEDCWQVVTIGPISRDALEQMRQDLPLFWENSLPYQQVLVGERTDGECDFTHPAVRAYLAISEVVSTDWDKCLLTVDVGPVTEKQIEEIERLGTTKSSTAIPATASPVPDRQ